MAMTPRSDRPILRATTIAMMFTGNVLGYLDRAAFAVAAPLIAVELRLDPLRLGWLLGAFSIGYVVTGLLGGVAADRWGATRVIAVAAVAWSIFCALTAVPLPFGGLFAIRILFGAGEAPYTPCVNAIVTANAAPSRYSRLFAFISAGQPLGGLLAGPVAGGLMLAFGWRTAFLATGAMGIVWAMLWIAVTGALVERRHQRDAGDERIVHGPGTALARCLSTPAIVGIAFAYFGFGYVLYFLITWFPTYLVKGLGVSIQAMSGLTTFPWAAGLVGLIAGGVLIDAMQRFPWGAIGGRRLTLSVSLSVAGAAMLAAAWVSQPAVAIALMSVAAFAIYLTGTAYLGLVGELVEREAVGGVSGFCIGISSLGGIAAPALTGFVVQRTGSFTGAFLTVAAVAFASALVVLATVRRQA